ncbi:MAG: MFS transporter [Ktedonobacterales bacterium]|nr:MFS transporter [Ktedonobacterales bacterium]
MVDGDAGAGMPSARFSGWRMVVIFGVIAFVGLNLRSVILAVPPVLPQIQHDLGLSYTATGLLTSLPVLLMGGAAWLAGMLIAWRGGRFTVALGLALLASGSLLRAAVPGVVPLYLCTVALSLGIALAQTTIPVLARQWFPRQIGLVAALYTDGLIVGETLGASLTVPVVLGLLGPYAWADSFIFWSVPVVVALALWLWLAPPAPPMARRDGGAARATPPRGARVGGWHLGLVLGAGSLVYFGMNTWIAPYNLAQGAAAATPLSLTVLNAAQLPVSLAMTLVAQRLAGRRWPFVAAGVVSLVATAGWVWTPVALQPIWAALLGGSAACVFVLAIALPALLADAHEVARLTGITLTISYSFAFLGPLVGGALWDLGQQAPLAFVPVGAAAVVLIVLGALLPPRARFGILAEAMEGVAAPDGPLSARAR